MSDSNEAAAARQDAQYGKYLTFQLGEEDFGLKIEYVTEIIGMQPITVIPEVPDYTKGIINLRGKIIPVICVRTKFKKEPIPYTDRTCIIVVETQDYSVGLIVDEVAEVINIDDKNVSPPPSQKTGVKNRYISGIGKVGEEIKLLLDCEELFREEEAGETGEMPKE